MKKHHKLFSALAAVILIFPLLSGCATPTPIFEESNQAWSAGNVLALDPLDGGLDSADILALYARRQASQLTLRIDLLNQPTQEISTRVNLFTTQDQLQLDFSTGRAAAIQPNRQTMITSAAIIDQPHTDRIVIQIEFSQSIPANLEIAISLLAARDDRLIDEIPAVGLSDPPPAAAKTALVFWNSMPASTPAQALRRWDGAHTGPFGQRHGLKHLLAGANQFGVPVILLDALTPNSLAALELLGQIEPLRDLQSKGIVTLALSAWGDPLACQTALELSRITAANYNLKPSDGVVAGPLNAQCVEGNKLAFAWLYPSSNELVSLDMVNTLPLPVPPYNAPAAQEFGFNQVEGKRLSDQVIKLLIEYALSENPQRIVVLGGSVPESLFGEQSIANSLFEYIADHPWIEVLTGQDLINLATAKTASLPNGCKDYYCAPDRAGMRAYTLSGESAPISQDDLQATLHRALQTLPLSNSSAKQAWLSYLTLTNPTEFTQKAQLQANFLGQVGVLLYAHLWAQQPANVSRCDIDLDWDGEAECVLSNSELLAVFEHQGAGMVGLFSRQSSSPIGWIAPSSTLAVGLGDPTSWKIESGPHSDPEAVSSAFTPRLDQRVFSSLPAPGEIGFTHPDSSSRVQYKLGPDSSIRIHFQSPSSEVVQIPILPTDAVYSSPAWITAYSIENTPDSIKINDKQMVTFLVNNGEFAPPESFINSLPFIRKPEDANQVFSQGHFLPFPITLLQVEIQSDANFDIRISQD
jgi:hypothetical protein